MLCAIYNLNFFIVYHCSLLFVLFFWAGQKNINKAAVALAPLKLVHELGIIQVSIIKAIRHKFSEIAS
jgi:hypothetical protein